MNSSHESGYGNGPSFDPGQPGHEAILKDFSGTIVRDLLNIMGELNIYDAHYVKSCIVDACSTDRSPEHYIFGSGQMISCLDLEPSVGVLFRTAFEKRSGQYAIEKGPLYIAIDTKSRDDYIQHRSGTRERNDEVLVRPIARRASFGEIQDPNTPTFDGKDISESVRRTAIEAMFGCTPDEAQAIRALVNAGEGYRNTLKILSSHGLRLASGLDTSKIHEYWDIMKNHNDLMQKRYDEDRAKRRLELNKSFAQVLLELGISDYDRQIKPIEDGLRDGRLRIIRVVDGTNAEPIEKIFLSYQTAYPDAKVLQGLAIAGSGNLIGAGKSFATIYRDAPVNPE